MAREAAATAAARAEAERAGAARDLVRMEMEAAGVRALVEMGLVVAEARAPGWVAAVRAMVVAARAVVVWDTVKTGMVVVEAMALG